MKLPQSFTEELKSRLRISEVIGQFLPIKRAGREFHALCPFHNEKTPSFTINDEKGFYHCFGCGAHGDVIGFITAYEHVGYMEAVQKLAGQAGLAMPQISREEQAREDRTSQLQRVLEAAASWMEAQREQSREGELARDYIKQRGLKPEIVARFRVGYAPADRDAMRSALKAQGITDAQMIEVGLLIKVEGRDPYARFRRRLMFPIRDRKSRVVGFGGRVLPGEPQEDAPKYLNSPETPLFHKGRQLYNYDLARQAAYQGGQLIIAEGYMDVLALAQAGFTHAVAPLGTAVTEDQLQLCWQMVPSPILCLDGDAAGARAMTRAMNLAMPLLVPGKSLQCVRLPKGEDPDSLLRHIGRAAMEEMLNAATPLAEMLWAQHMVPAATTPEGRAAQEAALMQAVGLIRNESVQYHYKWAMREKLRAEHVFVPNKAGKGFRASVEPSVRVPAMPVLSRDTAQALLGPVSKMLALVVAYPSLIADASAEEAWLCAPTHAGWQADTHRKISAILLQQPEASCAELLPQLREEISPESMQHLVQAMHEMGMHTKMDEATLALHAGRLWPEVLNDVHRITLKAEFAEAEMQLAREMSDEHFTRMVMLKQQLEALEHERSRFYREDPV